MTTHTDLIARLREDEANCHENAGEAADALADLEQQVAALTKERNEWKELAENMHKQYYNVDLAAAQAREAKLQEALMGLRRYSLCPDTMVRLLDIPADDSALQARLKEERHRCAEIAEDATAFTQFQTVEHYKISRFIADAIRGLA